MKYLSRFINNFRDIGNNSKGILTIKAHYLELSIQKHIFYGLIFFILLSTIIGIESASAWTVVLACIKELIDHIGLTKWIFKTILKKDITRTAFNPFDIIATIVIPILIQLINLYII